MIKYIEVAVAPPGIVELYLHKKPQTYKETDNVTYSGGGKTGIYSNRALSGDCDYRAADGDIDACIAAS